jgi:hypothetical protein
MQDDPHLYGGGRSQKCMPLDAWSLGCQFVCGFLALWTFKWFNISVAAWRGRRLISFSLIWYSQSLHVVIIPVVLLVVVYIK